MIEKRQLLNFYPPTLDGQSISNKKRFMLIIDVQEDNIIKMLNVSSLKNRSANLWYDGNIEIANYYPLPLPSFVKLNTIYEIEYFEELEKFIAKDGNKLTYKEFGKILKELDEYELNHEIKNIKFSEKDFKKYNENKTEIKY